MKVLWAAVFFSLASTSAGMAASVTVSDSSTVLPGVAATTTAVLLDAGLTTQNIGGGKYTVTAKKFHCDQYSRGALDPSNRLAALPTVKCRINSKNVKDTTVGNKFGEARTMNDLLLKIQGSSASGGTQFNDCASGGYCGTYAKSIKCTIDTTIANFNNGGRWSCLYTDGL
jgi:hypothetical protein